MIIAAKGLHFPALPVNGDLPLQRLFWGESLVLNVCLEICRLSLEVVPINKHKQIASIAKENTAQEHPSAEPPIPVEGSEERRNNICKAARGIHATAAAEIPPARARTYRARSPRFPATTVFLYEKQRIMLIRCETIACREP